MGIKVMPFWHYAGLNVFKWRARYTRWRKFSMVDGIIMTPTMLKIVIREGLPSGKEIRKNA